MTVPRSPITWTDYSGGDANFILRGAAPGDCEVSTGCAHCYAGAILRRSSATGLATTYSPEKLKRLLRYKFKSDDVPYRRGPGSRPMVFVCDMGDLFHENVPSDFIFDAIIGMAGRTDIDWQILTKRPRRMYNMLNKLFDPPPPNVWLGVSIENQAVAADRLKWLLKTPAAVRFLSCEPLLEPLDLANIDYKLLLWDVLHRINNAGNMYNWQAGTSHVHWIIVGGESGPRRRPFDPSWAISLRDQCQQADIPFFYKQSGGLRPGTGAELDGVVYHEFPTTGNFVKFA